MKKSFIAVLLLLSITLFITGCDKEKEQKTTKEDTTKTIELFDEKLGAKTTFKYDKKENYSEVTEEEGGFSKTITFKNEDLDVSFEMYYSSMREASYKTSKETRSAQKYYKEYKFGKYDAYAYGEYDDGLYLNIYLNKDDNDDVLVLFASIDRIDNNKEVIVSNVVADKTIQELLNSIDLELSN